jgi:hypothetical protein
MEYWALEEDMDLDGQESAMPQEAMMAITGGVRSKRKGKEAVSGRSATTVNQTSNERLLEQQMDGDADDILDAALGAVR